MTDYFHNTQSAFTQHGSRVIFIGSHFSNKDHTITRKEALIDVISQLDKDTHIYFSMDDGENLSINGFDDFIEQLIYFTGINKRRLHVITHDNTFVSKYVTTHYNSELGIFSSQSPFVPAEPLTLDQDAKLFGALFGRFTVQRLLLAYQMDMQVPDCYIVYQTKADEFHRALGELKSFYDTEINWALKRKNPFHHESPHSSGLMDWRMSSRSYAELYPKFKIEVVAETDCFTNFWFTEKTARCLAFGKPFMLFSGPNSLKRLRDDQGFETFGEVIYEKYDEEVNPRARIEKMINEMKRISSMPDDELNDVLSKLNAIAQRNKQLYREKYANTEI